MKSTICEDSVFLFVHIWDLSHTTYRRFRYTEIVIYPKGGRGMNTKEAVAKRILELCAERKMAINALATISGVSPSTIYSMLNEKSQNPGVVSIKKICDGLEISVRDFFDSELFENLEQEIQ